MRLLSVFEKLSRNIYGRRYQNSIYIFGNRRRILILTHYDDYCFNKCEFFQWIQKRNQKFNKTRKTSQNPYFHIYQEISRQFDKALFAEVMAAATEGKNNGFLRKKNGHQWKQVATQLTPLRNLIAQNETYQNYENWVFNFILMKLHFIICLTREPTRPSPWAHKLKWKYTVYLTFSDGNWRGMLQFFISCNWGCRSISPSPNALPK